MDRKMLIVGAGKRQREAGAVHLDINAYPGIDVIHDLNQIPWPFKDDSFDHINSFHVVEHLKSLIDYMDESWRILRKGGTMYVLTPHAGKNTELEYADPTHVRCYTTFSIINYFTLDGLHHFGYTDRAWAILKIQCVPDGPNKDCLEFLVTPLK